MIDRISRLQRTLRISLLLVVFLVYGSIDGQLNGVILAQDSGADARRSEPKKVDPISLENSFLRITVDAQTGDILQITNRKTNTDYLVGRQNPKPPFIVDMYSANQAVYIRDPFEAQEGGFSLYKPAVSGGVGGDLSHVRDPEADTVRVTREKTDAGSRLQCECRLPDGILVRYWIVLQEDSPLTEWGITVENRGAPTPARDQRVYRVAFPVLDGLRIGPRHESNCLARPYAQGELIPDPVSYKFVMPHSATPLNVLTYPGWASMSWQDLYAAEGGGLYLASCDPTFQQIDLESWPDAAAGTMTLGVRTLAFLEPGKSWTSQPFTVGVHQSDWHWAADQYRQWAYAHHHRYTGPEWVRKECDGWFGTGGPIGPYANYLKLFDDARWLGLNYLQIWSQMLENVGPDKSRIPYYCFPWPDPDRGGEAELTRVVQAIRAAGGHIGFYHNLWTWDAEISKRLEQWRDKLPTDVHVPAWWGESRRWASVFPDGSRIAGNYTNGYAGLCPAAEGYQDYLLSWIIDRYVKRYGADTWYFDSTPVTMYSASRVCFSSEHGPGQPHGVGQGILKLLQRLREAAKPFGDLAITSETVNDALMQYNSHALGLELLQITRYPRPEIYTYTFPEHPIFSGTCNGAGQGLYLYYPDMTPDSKPRREDALNRVFLMGYRFDLLSGRLDRQDPSVQYIQRLIALRQQIKADLYASDFRDEIGLGPLPKRIYVKLFRRRDGESLTLNLVDRRQDVKAPFAMTIELGRHEFPYPGTATLYEFDGRQSQLALAMNQGQLTLQIPSLTGEVAAIVVRRLVH